MKETMELKNIPEAIMPFINDKNNEMFSTKAYLRGLLVKRIYIMRDQIRVSTEKGEYRYPMDSDVIIEMY